MNMMAGISNVVIVLFEVILRNTSNNNGKY